MPPSKHPFKSAISATVITLNLWLVYRTNIGFEIFTRGGWCQDEGDWREGKIYSENCKISQRLFLITAAIPFYLEIKYDDDGAIAWLLRIDTTLFRGILSLVQHFPQHRRDYGWAVTNSMFFCGVFLTLNGTVRTHYDVLRYSPCFDPLRFRLQRRLQAVPKATVAFLKVFPEGNNFHFREHTPAASLVRQLGGGAMIRSGQAHIVINVQVFTPENRKNWVYRKRKCVWYYMEGGSKVNFPHRTLNKFSKFSCCVQLS